MKTFYFPSFPPLVFEIMPTEFNTDGIQLNYDELEPKNPRKRNLNRLILEVVLVLKTHKSFPTGIKN